MPSNNTHYLVHYWAGRYGNVGHIYGPSRTETPRSTLAYLLDNGAWPAFKNGRVWCPVSFRKHIERYAFLEHRPIGAIVPDVVANRDLTLAAWGEWASEMREALHLKVYIALQDGMTPEDVRALCPEADGLFLGGSTEWKWATAGDWRVAFPMLPFHIGRVNTEAELDAAAAAGADSCDGTGWFMGDPKQILQLGRFLAKQAGRYDEAEEAELQRVVRLSRTKALDQLAMPMEVASG